MHCNRVGAAVRLLAVTGAACALSAAANAQDLGKFGPEKGAEGRGINAPIETSLADFAGTTIFGGTPRGVASCSFGSDFPQAPNAVNGAFSDTSFPQFIYDDFVVDVAGDMAGLCFWGLRFDFNGGPQPAACTGVTPDNFQITVFNDLDGAPDFGTAVVLDQGVDFTVTATPTGTIVFGNERVEYSVTFNTPLALDAGCHWLLIDNDLGDPLRDCTWAWENASGGNGISLFGVTPGTIAGETGTADFAFSIGMTNGGSIGDPLDCLPPPPPMEDPCTLTLGDFTGQSPDRSNALNSDGVNFFTADNFLTSPAAPLVDTICVKGVYTGTVPDDGFDFFQVRIFEVDANGNEGTVVFDGFQGVDVTVSRGTTGETIAGFPEFGYSFALNTPVQLAADTCYGLEVSNSGGAWFWTLGSIPGVGGFEGDGRAFQGPDQAHDGNDVAEDADLHFIIGASNTTAPIFPVQGSGCMFADPVLADNDECEGAAVATTGLNDFDNSTASTGTTGQANAECLFFGSTAIDNDVWFEWTADFTGGATVSTCDLTGVDTKLAVYEGTCAALTVLGCSDDDCPVGLQSSVTFNAVNGTTYLIQLGTFPGAAGGVGQFLIESTDPVVPCDITIPGGATAEGEACGDADNEGCNTTGSVPVMPAYFDLTAGGDHVIAGQAFGDGGTRDTDWYEYTACADGDLTVTLQSEFDGIAFILDVVDCDPNGDGVSDDAVINLLATIDDAAQPNPGECEVGTSGTVSLTNGQTVIIFVSTGNAGGPIFAGVPCGGNNDYVLSVDGPDCGPVCQSDQPCPPDVDFSTVVDSGDFFTFIPAFLSGDANNPVADYDCSGTVDSGDFFAFIPDFLNPGAIPGCN